MGRLIASLITVGRRPIKQVSLLIVLIGLLGASLSTTTNAQAPERIIFDPSEIVTSPDKASGITSEFALSSQPSTDLAVEVTGTLRDKDLNLVSGGKVTVTPSKLTIKRADWQKKQKVSIQITGHKNTDTANITATGITTDGKIFTSNFLTVYLTNDAVQISSSILFSPASINYKKGGKEKVSVTLKDSPETGETVRVTLPSTGAVKSVDKSDLTFNAANYNKPQEVTVTFADNVVVEEINTLPFFGISVESSSKKYKYTGYLEVVVPKNQITVGGDIDSASPCSDGTTGPLRDCTLSERIADPDGYVYFAWQTMRSVINIILILALLLISFSNILRISIDTYAVKKALPNLVIGVILANASFLVIRYMADIASVAVYFFVDRTNSGTFSNFVAATLTNIGTNAIGTISAVATLPVINILIVLIMTLIALVGILWLAFILYFRLVAIYLLTILAPLAFVAYGIPGFEKYFKQWWQQFIKWLFILPAMSALFWVMYVIGSAGGDEQSIARTITQFLIFFTALGLPSKMGGKIVDTATNAFKKYSGTDAARNAASKFGEEKLSDAGKWLGSRTPGLYRLQEWNKLRKENFEKSIEERRMAAGTKARSGKGRFSAGKRAATLDYEKQISANERSEVENDQSRRALTDELAERLNTSEFTKNTAEKLKEIEFNTKKIEYYVKANSKDAAGNLINPKLNSIIKNFAKASSQAAAITDAVGTQEKIAVGNYTNGRLDVLSAMEQYAKMEKDLPEKAEAANKATLAEREAARVFGVGSAEHNAARIRRRDALVELRRVRREYPALMASAAQKFEDVKGEHADLAGLSIAEISAQMNNKNDAQGTIWKEEKKKQAKSYNGGIKAISEDMRENGSIDVLKSEDDYKDFASGDHARIKELAGGYSMNVDMKDQNNFQLYMYTLKDWMKSDRNANYRDAVKLALDTLVQHGGQTIQGGKAGSDIHWDAASGNYKNSAGRILNIATDSVENLKGIVAGLNRLDAMGGDPGRHINSI